MLLDRKSLLVIYYALFNNIATDGILAWGSAYDNNALHPLSNLQYRIFFKFVQSTNNAPPKIDQAYVLNSLVFYYYSFRDSYINFESKTRNKPIILPQVNSEVHQRNHI